MKFPFRHLLNPPASWYLSLGLIVWAMSLKGQIDQVRFDRFNDDDGLPHNLFKDVIQDQNGIIWMSGLNGLARYDGYDMATFRHKEEDPTSLSGNNLTDLYEDRDGRLWLGVFGLGVDVSDPFKHTFTHLVPPIPAGSKAVFTVHDITQDSTSRIWVASNMGDFIIEAKDGIFTWTTVEELHPSTRDSTPVTQVLYTDSLGRVWLGTMAGLRIFESAENRWLEPDDLPGLPQSEVNDIGKDRLGRIWVSIVAPGTRMYYTRQDDFLFRPLQGLQFASRTRILRFAFDHDNRLWVSSFNEQLYGYDFRDSSVFLMSSLNMEIAHERFFRRPFVDHTGDVWIPCEGFYIHRYPKGFRSYIHPYAFHQSNTCIYQDASRMWLAYREKGIVMLDGSDRGPDHFSTTGAPGFKIPVNHIQEILRLSSDNILLVGFNSIAIMHPSGRILHDHMVRGTNRAGYQDKAGRIWIGGYLGLHQLDESKGVIRTITLPGSEEDDRNLIQAIEEDEEGRLWLASDVKGLSVLNPEDGSIRQFLPTPGDAGTIPSTTVLDMDMDARYHVWLATDVGLAHYNPDTDVFQTYTSRHGLINDYITAVVCAEDGMIWVSTHAGISSFNPATSGIENYTRGDGLLNTGYYTRSKYYGKDGIIYFGGKNGVDYFHPSWLRQNEARPRMVFSAIRVNHQDDRLSDGLCLQSGMLDLSYKENVLEFEITGMYYTAQKEVEYFYKMEGLHDDWIALGSQRHILMSGLKPDSYTFRAKAVSGDGTWSSNELNLKVRIKPPFYGTLWFRIAGLVTLMAGLWGLIKARERGITRRERKESEVNRKMAELEKRALQAQMNPHFIYNSMNSIQQFMIVHDVEGAMKYLTRFSRVLRVVLNMSAQNRIPLYDEVKLIEDYLELENMRFPDKFSYDIQVHPDINIHTVEVPPFFIQPQVENAIRHGLLRKPTPGHLHIDIRMEGEDLRIVVEDNGIGRAAAMAIKGKEGRIVESKGLAIMEERLSHLHSHHAPMPMKITDLYDSEQQPTGTRVEIFLPLD